MKKMLIPILFFLLVSCTKKNDLPGSQTSLDFSAVDTVLNDSVPLRFSGRCYALIHVNGQTVYSKSYGGYDGNTRVLVASCSKWLSAAVVMRLVDEGTLRLSDTVGKFLPLFTSYHKGNITIAQLMSHTSGFPGNSSQGYESDPLLTLSLAADLIAKNVALINPPGTAFYYGGVSMQVAGRICEVATGKSWGALAAEKIFTPCGMTNTDYGLSANPLIAGGGRSTANDYIRFLDMLANRGVATNGTRVLSSAAVDAMEQSQTAHVRVDYSPYPLALLPTLPNFYGIGNWRDLAATNDAIVESCSPGAFGTHPWINYNKKITGILLTLLPANNEGATVGASLKVRSLARNIVP
ncbi:serine hydrolase domain-containing protein [Chitinophaga vietnamensis]|uniref:serine hydrolase domain-containing protein n=1 Tax=Chitinophaga vietnamensis TaxID=2593957 RepID=UPI001177C7D8|nr:serine hydrolase domain-containing protein [Chitinophaga vietnamensis]